MLSPPNHQTFEGLFDEHMARLWRLALRLCGKREDAEDLLQEAALIGFRSFGRFEPDTNFVAWMGMIIVNAHRNRLRANSHQPATVSLDSVSDEAEVGDNLIYERLRAQGKNERRGDPAARLFDALDGSLIAEAFSSLPLEFRECCALFWISELSYEQIAAMLDIPLGTVRSRLHRGRKLLQSALWSLACERGIVRDTRQGSGTSPAKTNLFVVLLFIGASYGAKMMR